MAFTRIVILGLVAAITYGIVHDQVTARVCVEYFTIGHVRLIDSESPTVLAFFWGIVATWWVGLPLGVMLATAARLGQRQVLTATDVFPSLLKLMAIMYASALVAGVTGFFLAQQNVIGLVGDLAERVPSDRHARFLADAWAHGASYGIGIVGGIVLAVSIFRRRGQLRSEQAMR